MRSLLRRNEMTDYKLVPIGPTPEMVEAAEDAYMPFGDMELAIRMALLAAPAVQWEVGEGVPDYINDAIDNLAHANYELSYAGYQERTRDVELIRAYVARARQPAPQPAEQQPAPDVAALVEALERISKRASEVECRQTPCSPIQRLFVDIMQQADDALAAYRKQQEKSHDNQ